MGEPAVSLGRCQRHPWKETMSVRRSHAAAMVLSVVPAVLGIGVAASQPNAEPLACFAVAGAPNGDNDARVGRQGCLNKITGVGRVLEERDLFPDDVVGSARFPAGMTTINGSCGNGRGTHYSEFSSSSGAYARSATIWTC